MILGLPFDSGNCTLEESQTVSNGHLCTPARSLSLSDLWLVPRTQHFRQHLTMAAMVCCFDPRLNTESQQSSLAVMVPRHVAPSPLSRHEERPSQSCLWCPSVVRLLIHNFYLQFQTPRRSSGSLSGSLALDHTLYATLQRLLLHLTTYLMLRCNIFSCTSKHT